MGNNHTTLASIHATSTTTAAASTLGAAVAGGGGDDGSNSGAELPLAQEIIDAADPQLSSVFKIDKYLVPGSGRMMRTFRLKNKQNGSAVVVKVMWVVMATDSNSSVNNNSTGGNSSSASSMAPKTPTSTTDGSDEGRVLIQTQQRELARIYAALNGKPHMAPFLYWKVGDAKSLPPPSRIQQMTMRPAVLIRPHFYTTLSDRLASRPFLTHVEKLWIVYQLLNALETMHGNVDVDTDRHDPIVHGFLTTENVGLSSWNWVVLTDISSYKARTALPDNDPSEYLYYFQELNQHRQGSDSTPREKRCYLAPERFYTPGDHHQEESSGHTTHRKKLDSKGDDGISKSTPRGYGEQQEGGDSLKSSSQNPAEFDSWKERRLTPAMDMFSAGCVIMETFLNGERAMDLGDLMEYRKLQSFPAILQQKLNKIEFSALRAACRHMLNLDPAERLTAGEYLDRLKGRDGVNTGRTELIPQSFEVISRLMSEVSSSGIHHGTDNVVITHDARIARAAAYYGKIVWETVGIHDQAGINYFCRALGKVSSVNSEDCDESGDKTAMGEAGEHGKESSKNCEEKKDNELDLFAETEALLAELGALSFDNDEVLAMESKHEKRQQSAGRNDVMAHCVSANRIGRAKRSRMSESSLLIYLQLVLSTIRHVQYPASKLVALQIIGRVASYSSDETRLQRIVPTTIALLHDQDPFCRASALQVLTSTISVVETFPPSDSKVFPQYIFKRIAHLITDPSLVVRLAFARSLAMLAETAHRFLDISHAVRLYEAIGGSTSCPDSTDVSIQDCVTSAVFGDDVVKLLDGPTSSSDVVQRQGSQVMDSTTDGGKILMNSTYNSELGTLQETVSRWVVHITTDFSEHSSPVKRALLEEMTRLCNFFGLDGVMAFILPQLLSFLNDRKDWQLRVSLIDHIPSVGHYIGRAATEHFVLPCLETALVDNEEVVISRALKCLSQLLRLGLLSRGALLGTQDDDGTQESSAGLLKQYGPLLLHPSSDIRFHAIAMVNAICDEVGSLDAEVFVVPILRPFLRFQPSSDHLSHPDGLEKCLYEPWSWYRFDKELERTIVAFQSSFSPTAGEWTSIALEIKDSESLQRDEFGDRDKDAAQNRCLQQEESIIDEQTTMFQAYLHMLARRKNRTLKMVPTADFSHEGSLKLAQTHVKFPRQDVPGFPVAVLPGWYDSLRDFLDSKMDDRYETTAIRTVSALGQVYGLSITDQNAVGPLSDQPTVETVIKNIQSDTSKVLESASIGEWGAEALLDPTLSDTSVLVTKLNGLNVPPLPPRLGEDRITFAKVAPQTGTRPHVRDSSGPRDGPAWKPKIDTVVCSSQRSAELGHIGPVVRLAISTDQRFFVSGSYDGTCRVWESEKAEKSNGVLESSLTYSLQRSSDRTLPRVNDLAMIEESHSIASAASDGSLHVWRVDMVSSSASTFVDSNRDIRRVAGSSEIRIVDSDEGQVLAVNQYNTHSASILMYATQKGYVHSWDLRSAREPFSLKCPLDVGYITSMAMGSDRHWAMVGTNRGFIALWDLRFHQIMKLWHHSRSSPINRLATSFVPPPQSWSGKTQFQSSDNSRPYLFVASGPNECAMFDVTSGSCSQCFRTIDFGKQKRNEAIDGVPHLSDIPLSLAPRRKAIFAAGIGSSRLGEADSLRSVNAMVGSIGASDHSFLLTGGSDCRIRFWDFSVPSKCYTCGNETVQPRPSYERIDFGQTSRLMLCRQAPIPPAHDVDSSKVPRKLFQGTRLIPHGHQDAIQDLKVMRNGLVSCSRDCTVKIWK